MRGEDSWIQLKLAQVRKVLMIWIGLINLAKLEICPSLSPYKVRKLFKILYKPFEIKVSICSAVLLILVKLVELVESFTGKQLNDWHVFLKGFFVSVISIVKISSRISLILWQQHHHSFLYCHVVDKFNGRLITTIKIFCLFKFSLCWCRFLLKNEKKVLE